MANIERNYKDNVFCMLYRDKENLLSLYNAVNGTEYRDAEGLKVVTLEQAICARMHNDAAFIIGTSLNLYEQQSTVNDNIPLRNLYYIAEELKQLIPTKNLYGRKAVKIPVPRFVVFYNGKEEQPEEKILKLSDLYETREREVETELDLELVVRQININSGHSADILRKCESLKGYMILVDKVREKRAAGQDIKSAVTEAVDECIREGVLSEFFREHRSEVIEMGIYEIDDETFEQVIREEGREEGVSIGRVQGRAEGIVIGKVEGKAEAVLELLEELGPIPEELRKTVMEQQDLDTLKNWHKLAARVESVEEFQRQCKI